MRSRLAIVLTGIALGLAMRLVLGKPEGESRFPQPKSQSIESRDDSDQQKSDGEEPERESP